MAEEVCAQLCEACIATAEYSENLIPEVKEIQAKCAVLKHFPQFARCKRYATGC